MDFLKSLKDVREAIQEPEMTSQQRADLLLAEHQARRERGVEVSATLERIERYSTWLVSDAETVQRNVRALKYQPGFETRAAATLQLAKERLETSLREVNSALTGFAKTPAEKAA